MSAPFPLTRGQARMLLAELAVPGGADQRVVQARLLAGPLDPDRFRAAFADVVARHPVLRTVYGWDAAGAPEQRVLDPDQDRDALGPVVELAADPGRDPSARAAAALATWWDDPVDLEAAPPVRSALLRVAPDEHVLALGVHHVAFDGWSGQVFLRDLGVAYEARLAGREPAWSPVPDVHAVRAKEEAGLAGWLDAELPFWRELLAALPPAPAGSGSPEPGAESALVDRAVLLTAADMADLATGARRAGGLPFAALLRHTARLLAPDGEPVTLGTVTSGRLDRDLRGTVGCLVNPVAVPVRPRDDLAATTGVVLSCLRHARTPYDEVVRRLRLPGRAATTAIVVLHRGSVPPAVGPLTVTPLLVPAPRTATPLLVELGGRPDGSGVLRAQWRADALPADRGRALVEDLADRLRWTGAAGQESRSMTIDAR